jgi:hypothetical protein
MEPAAPAHAIDPGVAPDQDQPRGRIARRAIARPILQGTQARLLVRFLRGIKIVEVAQQRADRLRSCRAAVVGSSRSDGPSLPDLISRSWVVSVKLV